MNIVIIFYMLKILTRNYSLLHFKPKRFFGSAEGPVKVELDKNAKWIKFTAVPITLPRIEN